MHESNQKNKMQSSHEEYYDSIAKGYNELHKEEQLRKLEIIKQHIDFEDKTVLDVGCGTAFISKHIECESYTGIDPSQGLLDQAPRSIRPNSNKPNLIKAPAENIPLKDHQFNIIISLTAMQNFDDLKKGLQEIKRVGTSTFALTILKSNKIGQAREHIHIIFKNHTIQEIEERHDIIFLIKN